MGIYAELLISDIGRRLTEGDLYGKVAAEEEDSFKHPTPEQVEAALAVSEEILADVRDNVPPIRGMPFKTVTRQPIYGDIEIVLLQWSPKPQSVPLLKPFYGDEKRARSEHYGLSVQVDAGNGSVSVLRPHTRSALSLVTEGRPLRIEGFLENPQLIIPNISGAALGVLGFSIVRSQRQITIQSTSP